MEVKTGDEVLFRKKKTTVSEGGGGLKNYFVLLEVINSTNTLKTRIKHCKIRPAIASFKFVSLPIANYQFHFA